MRMGENGCRVLIGERVFVDCLFGVWLLGTVGV
jgi:hypothetical protein